MERFLGFSSPLLASVFTEEGVPIHCFVSHNLDGSTTPCFFFLCMFGRHFSLLSLSCHTICQLKSHRCNAANYRILCYGAFTTHFLEGHGGSHGRRGIVNIKIGLGSNEGGFASALSVLDEFLIMYAGEDTILGGTCGTLLSHLLLVRVCRLNRRQRTPNGPLS